MAFSIPMTDPDRSKNHRRSVRTEPSQSAPEWIILTLGQRAESLARAVDSLTGSTLVVVNGGDVRESFGPTLRSPVNLGVPAGRDFGVRSTASTIVGFLDDDAVASPGVSDRIAEAFDDDPQLGIVALRLFDEEGATARRHVPRIGGRHPERGGEVGCFLGGACAMRRDAYVDVGGYWGDLFYGHEELELSWRIIDGGWTIRYLADATVFHPRTDIGRHPNGWRLTGRNRVMIARRTLPWPVAAVHVCSWLVVGCLRAPGRSATRAYVEGWLEGWRQSVDRSPIRWRTVWRLTRLGRPPVL